MTFPCKSTRLKAFTMPCLVSEYFITPRFALTWKYFDGKYTGIVFDFFLHTHIYWNSWRLIFLRSYCKFWQSEICKIRIHINKCSQFTSGPQSYKVHEESVNYLWASQEHFQRKLSWKLCLLVRWGSSIKEQELPYLTMIIHYFHFIFYNVAYA